MDSAVWLLNFDAELELARPRQYQPSKRVLKLCERFAPHAAGLLSAGDVILPRPAPPNSALGRRGVAWCPTPHARRELRRAGAQLSPSPSLHCLQQVNSRRFLASLGLVLPGAVYTRSRREVAHVLARFATPGCVLKRDYGFAGRGVRRIHGIARRDDWHWIDTALAAGGLLLEPWVRIQAEYSVHGYLPRNGALRVGVPCQQHVDARGRWLRTAPLDPSDWGPAPQRALDAALRRCAAALRDAGYFGPLGLDAYRYEVPGGGSAFQAHSELNARYTMGFAVGFAATAGSSRAD